MKVLVLTVSDRAWRGVYTDESGPVIETLIRAQWPDATVDRRIVPDEWDSILSAMNSATEHDVIITTGGTGLSPRDITPEVTESFCDRLIPGIAEFLRAESRQQTPFAVLSRGTAGMKGKTVVVNLPGSARAAEYCAKLLVPILSHALKMTEGGGHE